MLYQYHYVRATSMILCDDVIDKVITQIFTINLCDFYLQNWQNWLKLVANNDLNLNKIQLESGMTHFQSFQVKKTKQI